MEFRCVEECSQCCIEREYYPTKQFGKIGVLILPAEKEQVEKLAIENKIKIKILPRIGISKNKSQKPTKIMEYQLMGIEENGKTSPFLATKSGKKSKYVWNNCKRKFLVNLMKPYTVCRKKVRSILTPMIGPHWKLNTSIIYEFETGSANYLVKLKKRWNG